RLALVGMLTVAALATAATTVVLWLRGSGSTTPSEAGGPAEPTELRLDQRAGDAAGAGPDDASGAVSVVMPADLEWQEVAGVALPVSASQGPQNTSDGLATGFAHDPAGAVLAAINIVVRVNPQNGPGVFGPTLRNQVVGPDSPALRARVESAYETL